MCDSKLGNITSVILSLLLTVFFYGHIATANSAYMTVAPQTNVEDGYTPKEAAQLAIALASRAVERGAHDGSALCKDNAARFAPRVASLNSELNQINGLGSAPAFEAIQGKAEYILEVVEVSAC